ncbi:Bax inhibitor-1/YccA family membrane protein [Cryptosporangium phraense]|uniref:Bax inhibitor-1/YccA family protein n=1 Tax=Cryptosporangium phraense TaxID=2593070 RepID=A0A545AGY2_9ACTN|nr:Bax inhibitor-1/YccA family protein [Cryptosporangium phraense]TQS40520.1 Bax inhibitor-1/YccA family protein [Cryptosporangium phraense]
MKSSNPVLSRLADRSAQHATFHRAPAQQPYGGYQAPAGYGQSPEYAQPYAPASTERMTVDDVVVRTVAMLAVVGIFGAVGWFVLPDSIATGVAIVAAMAGLVLGLVISFAGITNPALILTYAAAEGLFLGVISQAFESFYPGIVVQAVAATFGVFFGMAALYKFKVIRVTPTFAKWVIGALIGVTVLMLVNFALAIFNVNDGTGLGLRSGGGIAIIFSLVCIGIAALTFALDFKQIEDLANAGADKKYAWLSAFGIVVGLVWLYLEILRLLSYFRN